MRNHLPHPPTRLPVAIGRGLLLTGLLLAAIGASFAPWVDRPAAALVLTAPDLAEFVKFLPEVRDGSLQVQRLVFLFPLCVVTLGLPLLSSAPGLVYPRWVRRALLFISIPLALTLLPPVWSPGVLLSAEFRPQAAACLLCLGLVAGSRWLKSLPTRPLVIFLLALWLAASGLALWQFYGVREAVAHAYASPILPGWGIWALVLGCVMAALGALPTIFGKNRPR